MDMQNVALWFILLVAILGVVAVLLMRPAQSACSSVTSGETTFYDCEGNKSVEQRSGPYTSYSPKFPSSERKRPAWKRPERRSKDVSRETYRPAKQQPYSWQRHSGRN